MRFLLALFALLFAVPASAATYRIDVSGQFDTVIYGPTTIAYDDTGTIGVGTFTYDISDGIIPDYFQPWITATSGSATYDDGYSNCSGLLTLLCGDTGYFDMATNTYYGTTGRFLALRLSETELILGWDGPFEWQYQGLNYFAPLGGQANGTVTSLSVTEVPLPASGLMLLSAIALCRLSSRKRGRR